MDGPNTHCISVDAVRAAPEIDTEMLGKFTQWPFYRHFLKMWSPIFKKINGFMFTYNWKCHFLLLLFIKKRSKGWRYENYLKTTAQKKSTQLLKALTPATKSQFGFYSAWHKCLCKISTKTMIGNINNWASLSLVRGGEARLGSETVLGSVRTGQQVSKSNKPDDSSTDHLNGLAL